MASTGAETSKCFRFFDLPAELRDMIYDLCEVERTQIKLMKSEPSDPEEQDTISTTVVGAPRLSLLLVNKQLNTEYMQQTKERIAFVVEDMDGFSGLPQVIMDTALTSVLAQLKRVQLNLTAFCHLCKLGRIHDSEKCTIESGLYNHLVWRANLLRTAGIEDLSVRVTLVIWKVTADHYWARKVGCQGSEHLQILAGDARTSEIEVRLSSKDGIQLPDSASFDTVSKGSKLFSTWTKSDGWVAASTEE